MIIVSKANIIVRKYVNQNSRVIRVFAPPVQLHKLEPILKGILKQVSGLFHLFSGEEGTWGSLTELFLAARHKAWKCVASDSCFLPSVHCLELLEGQQSPLLNFSHRLALDFGF